MGSNHSLLHVMINERNHLDFGFDALTPQQIPNDFDDVIAISIL